MPRYDQCDDACTVDCGHCKGRGLPSAWEQARAAAKNIETDDGFVYETDIADAVSAVWEPLLRDALQFAEALGDLHIEDAEARDDLVDALRKALGD